MSMENLRNSSQAQPEKPIGRMHWISITRFDILQLVISCYTCEINPSKRELHNFYEVMTAGDVFSLCGSS
jgi:hypothetical protein